MNIFINDMTYFKKKYYKFRIFLRNQFQRPNYILEQKKYESLCVSVVTALISEENSILIYTPKSFKYYLKNQTLGIYMVLDNGSLSVTNHKYSYEIHLTPKNERKVIRKFDIELEKKGEKYDEEMIIQIKDSLTDIYNKISKNEQEFIKNS